MTLSSGDLTTPSRVVEWLPGNISSSAPIISRLISSVTGMIYNRINRPRLYSQTFTRTLDGVGTYQLVLPDWPVTSITSVQMGAALLQQMPLPDPTSGSVEPNTLGYGYRFIPWTGNVPGDPTVLEFVNGFWYPGSQNIKIVYTAGYAIFSEAQIVNSDSPPTATCSQPQGIWCKDIEVTYADGTVLTPVTNNPAQGQYIPPVDSAPGVYTFNAADAGQSILISYSFIPSDLEEACVQLIAERFKYRDRIGVISQGLAGQETMTFMRNNRGSQFPDLPPEVGGILESYMNILPPVLGAPV